MGGAFASIGQCGLYHVAGNIILPKYNATPFGSAISTNNVATGRFTAVAGGVSTPVTIRGFDIVPGDETANRPMLKWGISGSAASTNLVTGNTYFSIENIILDGNTGTTTLGGGLHSGSATPTSVYRVKIANFNLAPITPASTHMKIVDFEMTGCTAALGSISNFSVMVKGGFFHDNTAASALFTVAGGGTVIFDNCIFSTNNQPALTHSTASGIVLCNNCIFYATSGTNPGVNVTFAPTYMSFVNCHFDSNTSRGLHLAGAYTNVWMKNCSFYNNTTEKYESANVLPSHISGEVIPTTSPFIGASTNDFRLNNATNGGKMLRGHGFPSNYQGLTWNNFASIGASQPATSMAGGGYFNPF